MKLKRTLILTWAISLAVTGFIIMGYVWTKKMDAQSLILTLAVYLLVLGAIVLTRRRRQSRGGNAVQKDERTIRLANRAASYSWMISILAISGLMYFEYLELLRLSAEQVLLCVLLVMLATFYGARAVLAKKGDID
jgi:hypothetical protein